MRLAEILLRKRFLDEKIEDLENYLLRVIKNDKTSQTELIRMRKELDSYLDESRRTATQISMANNQIEVTFGESKIYLKDALRILETTERKIDLISDIIRNSDGNINVFEFIEQREHLYEEYFMLVRSIKMIEWSADID